MPATDGQCSLEQPALKRIGPVYLVFHSNKHLLPKTGHRRHAGGIGLAQRLLYLLGIGVDDYLRPLGEAQYHPRTLKDVGDGKEIHDTVFVGNGHHLIIGLQAGMILSVGEHHALAVARGSTGIENVAKVVFIGLLIELFHFCLTGITRTQLQKVVKIGSIGISRIHLY